MNARQSALVGVPADRLTLADILAALDALPNLSQKRRRELKSCVHGVAKLCDDLPRAIPVDFANIRARLAATNPTAHKMTPKRFANIKWGFAYAVRATGLLPVDMGRGKIPLHPVWKALLASLPDRRGRIGLSRLAHFASGAGVQPSEIDDSVVDSLLDHLDNTSLHAGQRRLKRTTTIIWNEVAGTRPELGLKTLAVPTSRQKLTRMQPSTLPARFASDVEAYLGWCSGVDPFADRSRDRILAVSTITTRRGYISAAVTSLGHSGYEVASITGLADLVSRDAFKRILKARCERLGRREDAYTFHMGLALVQIAREWVDADADALAELRRMVSKVKPRCLGTMTERNTQAVMQFDDQAVQDRLREAPTRIWREAISEKHATWRTLARAQAALALAILTYMPLRLQNLTTLSFDVHLHLLPSPRASSTLVVPGEETKNGQPIAYDIPPHIVAMLLAYRDDFVPKLIGVRPKQVFINIDGQRKTDKAIRYLIETYMRTYVGVDFAPHMFRHLAAATILRKYPGGHGIVKDLLGHKSLATSTNYYIGIRTREAGLQMQRLLHEVDGPRRDRRTTSSRQRAGSSA